MAIPAWVCMAASIFALWQGRENLALFCLTVSTVFHVGRVLQSEIRKTAPSEGTE